MCYIINYLILQVSEICLNALKNSNNTWLKVDQLDHVLHDSHEEGCQRYVVNWVSYDLGCIAIGLALRNGNYFVPKNAAHFFRAKPGLLLWWCHNIL